MADGGWRMVKRKDEFAKAFPESKRIFRFFNLFVGGKWKIVQNENEMDAMTNKMTLTMNQLPIANSIQL